MNFYLESVERELQKRGYTFQMDTFVDGPTKEESKVVRRYIRQDMRRLGDLLIWEERAATIEVPYHTIRGEGPRLYTIHIANHAERHGVEVIDDDTLPEPFLRRWMEQPGIEDLDMIVDRIN